MFLVSLLLWQLCSATFSTWPVYDLVEPELTNAEEPSTKGFTYDLVEPESINTDVSIKKLPVEPDVKMPSHDKMKPLDEVFASVEPSEAKQVEKVIGSGGNGDVKLITRMDENGCVVRLAKKRYVMKSNAREIAMLRSVKEVKDVIQFVAVEQDSIGPYLLTKYIDGINLHDYRLLLAKRGKTMEPRYVAAIIRQLLMILKEIHGLKIVHADIKPGNLMISGEDGRVKLIDFDLAVRQDAKIPSSTEMFEAPEEVATPQTDVWLVGMMVAYLFTGGYGHQLVGPELYGEVQIPIRFHGALREFLQACLKMKVSERGAIDELLDSEFIKSGVLDSELAQMITDAIVDYRTNKDELTVPFNGRVKMDALYLRRDRYLNPTLLIRLLPKPCASSVVTPVDLSQIEVDITGSTITLTPESATMLEHPQNQLAFVNFYAQQAFDDIRQFERLRNEPVNAHYQWSLAIN